MRIPFLLSALLAGALAAPVIIEPEPGYSIASRQQRPVKPQPCEPIVPAPTEEQTAARHALFADAFIYKKNITAAFEFINKGYIVRHHASFHKKLQVGSWILMRFYLRRITTQQLKMASIRHGMC